MYGEPECPPTSPGNSIPWLLHANFIVNNVVYETEYFIMESGHNTGTKNSWSAEIVNSNDPELADQARLKIENGAGADGWSYGYQADLWGEADYTTLDTADFSDMNDLIKVFDSFGFGNRDSFLGNDEGLGYVNGEILSISASRIGAEVPEPSIFSLLLFGVSGLYLARRSAGKSRH